MLWKKLGRIFCPSGESSWMVSHAANPFAHSLGDGLFRVFFSCRDANNRSSIGTADIHLERPHEIRAISRHPVLGPGSKGSFDDSGTSMGCLVNHADKLYLYYLGWNLGVTVPWRNSVGLATGSLDRFAHPHAPILDRNETDPFTLSYPWVLKRGAKWQMWYGSHLDWGDEDKPMRHVIKMAESEDGLSWHRSGVVAIGLQADQCGLSRPCVVEDSGGLKMWYSERGDTYRLSYAESRDGLAWNLKGSAGLEPSAEGWDSEAVCYAHVFDYGGKRHMLYCGNGYGKTGFGLAVQEAQ